MMKDIPGFPGYKINENGIVINKSGHVFRPAISNSGYFRISLNQFDDNGQVHRKNMSISRLVATTFIPNPDNLPVVMHKDNDTLHNHVSNLKWGTTSENIQQAFNENRKVSPNKGNHDKYSYKVYNENETILCAGYEGVAELLGFTNLKSVRPGVVKSGPYKGYTVENRHIRLTSPISFIDQNIK